MNVHAPRHFVPPRPDIPEKSVNWYGFLRALRTNALQIWPREAYTKDVLEQSFFRRKRFLLNAPEGIHRVLVDNIENYRRTRATIRILRPITGEGLFLSEGDEWRHQRRTIAPTLAPRVIPMLARHIAESPTSRSRGSKPPRRNRSTCWPRCSFSRSRSPRARCSPSRWTATARRCGA